jgi:hypothetical protein
MIFDPERQAINDALSTILIDGLIPAFEHLKRIRVSVEEKMPLVNRWQLCDDFSRQLWYAHKELMPKAALLLGFDLGFLFQKEVNFDAGVIVFNKAHPSLIADVCSHLRKQRKNWQNDLAEFRNQFLEHRQADREKFAAYYTPKAAEVLFNAVWQTMADLFPIFIESHFSGSFSIEPVPLAEQDPKHPRRFRYVGLAPKQANEEPAPP